MFQLYSIFIHKSLDIFKAMPRFFKICLMNYVGNSLISPNNNMTVVIKAPLQYKVCQQGFLTQRKVNPFPNIDTL